MRLDFARLSLLSAITWLVVIVGMAVAYGTPVATPGSTEPESLSVLGAFLQEFQDHFPAWSKVISAVMVILAGFQTGRLTVRYGLYPVTTSLAIPLYGIVACCIAIGQEYLVSFTSAYVLMLSTRQFFAAYRHGYAIGTVFRASFYLGLLPLLYAPAWPLVSLFVLAAICFRRTLREVVVSLCGVVFPVLTACYVTWWRGSGFWEIPVQLWNVSLGAAASVPPASLLEMPASTEALAPHTLGEMVTLILAGLIGLLVVTSIVICVIEFRRRGWRGRKAQSISAYTILLFLSVTGLMFLPSGMSANLLPLLALPAAILIPQTLLRLKQRTLTALFLLLICVSAINLFAI